MHLSKIANGAESQILQHNSRSMSHHSNTNIDASKSHLNYNLTEPDGRTSLQRFKDRLSECSYRKQKNNVRMESIIITAPKNIRPADMEQFFRTAHKELQELTGGKDNEVSAWCHMDEHFGHLHYNFVPAVEVNGTLKLSAKTLMNRDKLKILHPTMQAAIDKAFGHHEYIVVADDPRDRQQSSDTIAVYKAKQEKINQLNSAVKLANEQQEDAFTSIMLTFEQQAKVNKDIKTAKEKLNALNDRAEKTDIWLQTLNNSIIQKGVELEEIEGKIERLEQYLKDNQYMSECIDLRHYIEENIDPEWLDGVWNDLYGEPENVQQYSDWEDELGL